MVYGHHPDENVTFNHFLQVEDKNSVLVGRLIYLLLLLGIECKLMCQPMDF